MSLRLATKDDFLVVSEMARKFYETTPYFGVLEYDDSKMADTILGLFSDPKQSVVILALKDDEPVGMLVGQVGELLVSRDRVATEMAWWMSPEHRSSKKALELIGAYEYWAKEVAGCQYVQLSCLEDLSIDRVSRFYTKKGYKPFEKFFIKALN